MKKTIFNLLKCYRSKTGKTLDEQQKCNSHAYVEVYEGVTYVRGFSAFGLWVGFFVVGVFFETCQQKNTILVICQR